LGRKEDFLLLPPGRPGRDEVDPYLGWDDVGRMCTLVGPGWYRPTPTNYFLNSNFMIKYTCIIFRVGSIEQLVTKEFKNNDVNVK